MKLDEVHNECKRCANLKAWNIHMNCNHDYCCRYRPSGFINKDLHWEPCEKFEEKLFEYGECSESAFSRIFVNSTSPDGFCDKAEKKE